jgi:hypothetical protein
MNEEPIFDHEKLDVYQIELLFNHLRLSVCERGGQPTVSVTNHWPPSFSSSSSFSRLIRSRTSTRTITRRNKGDYDE